MSELTEHLRQIVDEVTSTLPRLSWRRMFGCDAVFVDKQIFGLIWKEGRVGVKLPETAAFDELMRQSGAAQWAPGGMKMSHWVLAPEDLHDDVDELGRWLRRAHALALAPATSPKAAKSKPARAAKKKAARKPAPYASL